jgi:hypothetical protein
MAAMPDSIAQSLRVAQQNASRIQQLLEDFRKQMPEQDLTRFTSELAEQPDRMAKIKTDLANLTFADVTLHAEVLRIKDRAEAEANLLSNAAIEVRRHDDIRQAKAQSQLMMQKLSKERERERERERELPNRGLDTPTP